MIRQTGGGNFKIWTGLFLIFDLRLQITRTTSFRSSRNMRSFSRVLIVEIPLLKTKQPYLQIIFWKQMHIDEHWKVKQTYLLDERWRWLKQGPVYLKVGGKVCYPLADIEAYERRRRAETHSSVIGSWK
jgi:hypothetical protein